MDKKESLSGMTPAELQGVAEELGLPRFNAKQIAQWLYQKQIFGLDEMTNLSKAARARLAERYEVGRMKPKEKMVSKDGTVKYLFPTRSGHYVETVFIPSEDRGTVCVSSQVGCKMGCRFCMTGRQGFQSQLSTADILNQIYSLPEWERLTNIVFMGQGEPLDNIDAVLRACEVLTAPYGMAWSPKRITVSTVGDAKGLKRFLDESDCSLAVSLHFPTGEQRAQWMPAEKIWPVEKTLEVLRRYDFCKDTETGGEREGSHQRRLSFEYIVFRGLNDTTEHAAKLVELLKGLDCRVNLIPFHDIPKSPFHSAGPEKMRELRDYLNRHGQLTTVRASRGQDIMAACGLLSTAEKEDKMQAK